jgi:hypothetical protein
MEVLNKDMQDAVDTLDMPAHIKELLVKILYNERLNKNREWTSDAVKYIKDQIDDLDTEKSE